MRRVASRPQAIDHVRWRRQQAVRTVAQIDDAIRRRQHPAKR
jgi:hypothetical protein